jgi:N-acetylmuramic acid 6-phosphate etherase
LHGQQTWTAAPMTSTETQDARYAGIDRWSDEAIVEALHAGQRRAVESVYLVSLEIAKAARVLAERLAGGGRLIYAGAGSSIAIAVQDGSELPGTFGLDRSRILFLIAGGANALVEIDNGAEDNVDVAVAAVAAAGIGPQDCMIAVSASGTTPYTVAAAYQAKVRGALVIGLANNDGTQLLRLADHPILLDSGPEVIAGSTRMAAGTAQKVALNLLSTLTHIRLGAVMDGMMVGVKADNAKLRKRAAGIVATLSGCDTSQASAALEKSQGDIKLAVLLRRGAASLADAQQRLAAGGGDLRIALATLAAHD